MAEPPKKTPWRDNIEALTVAIIMAVVLKYFIIEAYKIPTGSMQPTLMGHDGTNIHDRILVDKLSYTFRDPQRWEVAVFKYPLDRSKNFVKRICGMPGEYFRIKYGDLWTRPDEQSEWKVLRRPNGVQGDVWKALDMSQGDQPSLWAAASSSAGQVTTGARRVEMRGDGRARFPGNGSIRDAYNHGYPRSILNSVKRTPGNHNVGDLRVTGRVRVDADCVAVAVEFEEGTRRYRVQIPGPAAGADATPRLVHTDVQGRVEAEATAEPYRLPAGRAVSIAAENLDDLVKLEIGGKVRAELEIPFAADLPSAVSLVSEGEGGEARFDQLQVYRDIYYTDSSRIPVDQGIKIGDEQYFMLGDNTQDSSDSRDWQFVHMRWADGDELGPVFRGNLFPGNPHHSREGITWFRDEWGELYTFPTPSPRQADRTPAPFVPRHLITGRALLVFWPVSWKQRVWRPRWIH